MTNKIERHVSEPLDFRNGFGYLCHLDLSQKPKMSDTNGSLDAAVRLSPEVLDLSEVTRPHQVSQGTQAGLPAKRPRPLLHHSSEYALSRPLPPRLGNQRPFYTGRSGQPYPADPLPYTGYLTTATRARRGRPYPNYATDSPTSSLDCLATKDWSTDTMHQGKPNGLVPGEDRRLGTPSGGSSRSCRCSCHCGGGGGEPEPPGPQSAEGLSWRRLHMSRAKLKATATTSELLSGFAMIAMVELQINEPTNVPEWLFVMFAVCTTVLVAVHIFALMISTYLLPTIDAVSKMSAGDVLRESPHERMRGFIELAWAFSTVLGLFLFLVEIAILCWVKFWDYSFVAATAATVIVIPVLIVFVAFAVHFYHSLVVHKCEASTEDMEQLESMKRNLDSATTNTTAHSPV